MVIPNEIQQYVENHIELLIQQTKSYLPFIKIAFPFSKNVAEACYSLIVGNALSVFINQYAIRMKYPIEEDFVEFGKLTVKYKDRIENMF
ncbi:MAG: hypothetical protein WD154_02475 [Nitrosopumilaceae archaeon]